MLNYKKIILPREKLGYNISTYKKIVLPREMTELSSYGYGKYYAKYYGWGI